MIKNYFKSAFRNFKKRKVFSFINLIGLATGMAVCLLLALYIQSEFGYDNFHEKRDQIYRLAAQRIYPGRTAYMGEIPRSIGQAAKLEFPEVLESVRIFPAGKKVKIDDKIFQDEKIMSVDSNFFRVFTANFVEGSKDNALQKPNTAVINESTAIRFFGSTRHAMGKHIFVNGFNDYMIDGICKDWRTNHIFNLLYYSPTQVLTWMNRTITILLLTLIFF
ncbi:MAG: ABC transporter permease [Agriterribacter sp.]